MCANVVVSKSTENSGCSFVNSEGSHYIKDTFLHTSTNKCLTTGTWCDNIIIQAVANAQNCAIRITESDINKPDGTIITPVNSFIGSCIQFPHTLMNAT